MAEVLLYATAALILTADDYLPYLPFYVWIFENKPVGLNASSVYFEPLNMAEKYSIWKEESKKYSIEKGLDFQIIAISTTLLTVK